MQANKRATSSHTPYQGKDQDQESASSSHPSSMQMLPVELLTHIFSVYASLSPDYVHLALLTITHVCHHWRTIALSHGQLWTSVTTKMSLRWIKAFMERSKTTLMDFDLHIISWPAYPYLNTYFYQEDIILLFKGFTRVRSLCFRGCRLPIGRILNSLCNTLPIQSLSLFLNDRDPDLILPDDPESNLILPDDLFGGKAPIRRLQFLFTNYGCVVAPGGLIRGVTHFTSCMSNTPSDLLNVLCQMPALTYFEFRPLHSSWKLDMTNLRTSPIQMPELKNLVVRTDNPNAFIVLNSLLLLHVDAKRRMELYVSGLPTSNVITLDAHQVDCLSRIVEAANGFKHIYVSGTQRRGWFRLWTGDAATTWEDAEFCLSFGWIRLHEGSLHHFIAVCNTLGVARACRLVIDSPLPGLPMSSWWKLLKRLPGIEELELYSASVDTLGAAWKVNLAPAVLPALRRVRILDSELAWLRQYEIIGDPPGRKIVRLPSSTESDVAQFPEMVSAEKELEDISKSLLKLLRGLGRKESTFGPRKGRRR